MSMVVTSAELARDAQDFLRFKRAMGMSYRRAEFVLNSFVRFVAQHGEIPLDEAVTRWSARIEGRKAVTVGNEFGVVRQLCLYRRRRDPSGYVPEHALAPIKESVFLPYIFTYEEVRQLLAAATAHHGRFIWSAMLRTLMLVLYCTGMRLGEPSRQFRQNDRRLLSADRHDRNKRRRRCCGWQQRTSPRQLALIFGHPGTQEVGIDSVRQRQLRYRNTRSQTGLDQFAFGLWVVAVPAIPLAANDQSLLQFDYLLCH